MDATNDRGHTDASAPSAVDAKELFEYDRGRGARIELTHARNGNVPRNATPKAKNVGVQAATWRGKGAEAKVRRRSEICQ